MSNVSMTNQTVSFDFGCMKYVYVYTSLSLFIYVYLHPSICLSIHSDLIHGEVVDIKQKEKDN